MINKKIFTTILAVSALVSCSSIDKKENINKKDEENISVKYTYKGVDLKNESEYLNAEREGKIPDRLKKYKSSDFEIKGLNYLYEGEEIYQDVTLDDGVRLVKIFSKNPSFVLSEDDEKYTKYESKKNEIKVTEVSGRDLYPDNSEVADKKYKKVEFVNPYLYVQLRDDKTGLTRDVLIKEKVNIKPRLEAVNNLTRYEDIKNGKDNGRIKYSFDIDRDLEKDIASFEEKEYGESELPKEFEDNGQGYDWGNDLSHKKYWDEDDYFGPRRVTLYEKIDGAKPRKIDVTLDFGIKISDFKDNYEKLLSDLSKVPLKYTKTGDIEGGFDTYYTDKITRYHGRVKDQGNIEFVTEVIDGKKTVGKHKIVRKIIRDGKEIYRKEDYAYINFPGTTVIVADGTFFDISDEIEKRTLRLTPKSEDITTDYLEESTSSEYRRRLALQNLIKQHGATVIGSMIDEIAVGDRYYWYGSLLDFLIEDGLKEKSEISWIKNRGDLNKTIGTILSNIKSSYEGKPVFDEYVDEILKNAVLKLDEITRLYEQSEKSEEVKMEDYKRLYGELRSLANDIYMLTENKKLEYTDLHFVTMSVGRGQSQILPQDVGKNLSAYLDENRAGAKVINMSYGNNFNVEEYKALMNMSTEDMERATKEYNENPAFRFAIAAWLKNDKDKELDWYKDSNGNLSIPSVYSYFKSKEKITVEDYKKLVDYRLLTLNQVLKNAPELTASGHDILFVRAQGNTLESGALVDLVNFDEKGEKIVYQDPNYHYNNGFTSVPTFLNEKAKEKAKENGTTYKYDYSYRKNMLGSVGLAPKLILPGIDATENISDFWGIYTDTFNMKRFKLYGVGMLSEYNALLDELNKISSDESKYSKEYKEEILKRLKYVDDMANMHYSEDDKTSKFSFSRAGDAKLWTVAADGGYVYTKELTEEEKKYNPEDQKDKKYGANTGNFGSSFSAPRTAAVAAEILTKFPFMTAHDAKQTILTTAIDDFRTITVRDSEEDTENNSNAEEREEKTKVVGLYGVDENIGWGILDKGAAYRGPARFVRALTHEVGQENFVADIPNGYYEFSNSIQGGFDPVYHMISRNFITEKQGASILVTAKYSNSEILADDFLEKNEEVAKALNNLNITPTQIVNELRPKIKTYIPSLPFEERELFESAGLEKKGNGTLVLSGNNTYSEPTYVKGGTLIVKGSNLSDVIVEKGAKLKLDSEFIEKGNAFRVIFGGEPIVGGIKGKVVNYGSLYSYSSKDKILNTYSPMEGSKTNIAGSATLTISNLDLSNVKHFDIDVFRKKGMNIFTVPEEIEENNITEADVERYASEKKLDFNKKLILDVKNISSKDLSKINLGTFNLSNSLNLVLEKVENEDKTLGLKVFIERKNKIEFDFDRDHDKENKDAEKEKEKAREDYESGKLVIGEPDDEDSEVEDTEDVVEDDSDVSEDTVDNTAEDSTNDNEDEASAVVSEIRDALVRSVSRNTTMKEITNVLSEIEMLDELTNEEKSTLNGDILADSMLLGFDISELRNKNLKDSLKKLNKNSKYTIFANSVTDIRIRKNDNKTILNNIYGTYFGATLSTPINTFGISFDYYNNKLEGIKVKKEKIKTLPEEGIDGSEKILNGDAIINSYGLTFMNEFKYKGFYLDTILTGSYITKDVSRKILDEKVNNTKSDDFILNFNNEFGYTYNHKINDRLSLNVTPYIALDVISYNKGAFSENHDYGYSADKQTFNKVNTTIGTKLELETKYINASLFVDYTKYLTNTDLDQDVEIKKYNFTRSIKGVKLRDHSVNFGLNVIGKINNNISINASYKNRNLYDNAITAGIKFEF